MTDLPDLDFAKRKGHDGPHLPVRLDPPGSVQRDTPDPYPEHTKQHAILPQSQAIGEFLEWLTSEHGYVIGEWDGDDLHAVFRDPNSWLAQYFQIDPVKIELEKRAMLDAQRALNAQYDADREAEE
ncbi:MAG TPA: hypothetical protein VIT65_10785 [Microlunatus sp.]